MKKILIGIIVFLIFSNTSFASEYTLDEEKKCFNGLIETSSLFFKEMGTLEKVNHTILKVSNSIDSKIVKRPEVNFYISKAIYKIIDKGNYFSTSIKEIQQKSLFTLLLEKRLNTKEKFNKLVEKKSFCKIIEKNIK